MKLYVRMSLLSLVFVVADFAFARADEQLAFTPYRISEIVDCGDAPRLGAVFAPSSVGSWSHLWRDSDKHHVFFIYRLGRSFGEYREEWLSEGRFIEITENYLITKARESDFLENADEYPFVCRKERFDWRKAGKDNTLVCTGSTVQWSFLWCDGSGNINKRGQSQEQKLVRQPITVHVAKAQLAKNKEYSIHYHRKVLTDYEQAFGTDNRSSVRLVNGECSFSTIWPPKEPKLVIELHERVPNPPNDATPFAIRTKAVATMTVDLNTVTDGAIAFSPD
jgi:hypothetical protein